MHLAYNQYYVKNTFELICIDYNTLAQDALNNAKEYGVAYIKSHPWS